MIIIYIAQTRASFELCAVYKHLFVLVLKEKDPTGSSHIFF